VALIELRDNAQADHQLDTDALRAHCTSELARFKVPKAFIVVEKVRRLGNGKADYRWAKHEAAQTARTQQ
jgi:fatty-acyl-CoA synthase